MEHLHPAQQLADTMGRLYTYGLTTTSGGNLSIRTSDGTVWITPGGIDKANLTKEDMIRIDPDGTVTGKHKSSLETAFHLGIYEARKDVHAVVHAHAPATSAFCISRAAPDTSIIPQTALECGPAVMSGYAMPGSNELRENIARQAHSGYNSILLDHHGTVTVGASMLQALQRFEALDVCAETQLLAGRIGVPEPAGEDLLRLFISRLSEDLGTIPSSSSYRRERIELAQMAGRAYRRRLMTSTLGSLSMRVSRDAFIITPFGKDRLNLSAEDIVLVSDQGAEEGKQADLWMFLHRAAYRADADTASVMTAMPPSAMAYAVTGETFDARTLTEAYVILRDITEAGCKETIRNPEDVVKAMGSKRPVMLISHGGLASVGADPLQVLDRIEVAEVSMRSALSAHSLGAVQGLKDEYIQDMIRTFDL